MRHRLWEGEPPRPQRELLARDVVRLVFYMPHDHPELASGVRHAIETYVRAVGEGPGTITLAFVDDDEGDELTRERWNYIHHLLQFERKRRFFDEFSEDSAHQMEKRGYDTQLLFTGGRHSRNGYELRYRARIPWRTPSPDAVSLLTATLPTEYLTAHGPARIRELALEMASQLRFVSGHVGLALRLYWPLRMADAAFRAELLRYPGLDLRPAWLGEERMGTRLDGVHWLNFIAQPVLPQTGGGAALRSRLHAAGTVVRELDADRVLIELGEWPDAGDLTLGRTLPAYRELARLLEPWLEPPRLSPDTTSDPPRYSSLRFTREEALRWWRRFLD